MGLNGLFHPATPADMATILVKWKQLGNALQSVRFSATVGHWAEGRIVTVIEKGFCSDQPLTRAGSCNSVHPIDRQKPDWVFSKITEATVPYEEVKQGDGRKLSRSNRKTD